MKSSIHPLIFAMAWVMFQITCVMGAEVITTRWQWSTVGESRIMVQLKNNDGDATWGAVYGSAQLNLESMIGEVVQEITRRNPAFPTRQSVYQNISLSISPWPPLTAGVYQGWFVEANYSTGIVRIFNLREINDAFEPDIDYTTWRYAQLYPLQSSMTLYVLLGNMLDFNSNGRTDPDEALVWDGRWVGRFTAGYPDPNLPHEEGFVGMEGITWYEAPVPRFSLGLPKMTPLSILPQSGGALRLSWPVDDPDYINWSYLVQHSPSLAPGSWTNLGLVTGMSSGLLSYLPSISDTRGFYRLQMHNSLALTPRSPSPTHETSGHPKSTLLSWAACDGAVSYEVYFAPQVPPGQPLALQGTVTTTSLTPPVLEYDTGYYWQVMARLEGGITIPGPVWSFRTMPSPTRFASLAQGVGPAGVTYPLQVIATENWSLTPTAPWVSVTPASGSGNTTVQVTVAPNLVIQERAAIIQATGTAGSSTHAVTQLEAAGGVSVLAEDWESGSINLAKWQPAGPMDISGMVYPRVLSHAPALGNGSLHLSSTGGTWGTYYAMGLPTVTLAAGMRVDLDVRISSGSGADGNYTRLGLSTSAPEDVVNAVLWGPSIYRKANQPTLEVSFNPGQSVTASGALYDTWQTVSVQFLEDGSMAWMLGELVLARSAPGLINYATAPAVRVHLQGRATRIDATTGNGSMSDNLKVWKHAP